MVSVLLHAAHLFLRVLAVTGIAGIFQCTITVRYLMIFQKNWQMDEQQQKHKNGYCEPKNNFWGVTQRATLLRHIP